jgi:hypothetical protein
MEYYEMVDRGGHNVYHLLIFMISSFLIANLDKQIYYYYPFKDVKFEDQMLNLLPPNFHRQNKKTEGISYKSLLNAIPTFEDSAIPESYFFLRKLFKNFIYPTVPKKENLHKT